MRCDYGRQVYNRIVCQELKEELVWLICGVDIDVLVSHKRSTAVTRDIDTTMEEHRAERLLSV
jgi:hypothetical protein